MHGRSPQIPPVLARKSTAFGTMHHAPIFEVSISAICDANKEKATSTTYVLSQMTKSPGSFHGTLTVYLSCVA